MLYEFCRFRLSCFSGSASIFYGSLPWYLYTGWLFICRACLQDSSVVEIEEAPGCSVQSRKQLTLIRGGGNSWHSRLPFQDPTIGLDIKFVEYEKQHFFSFFFTCQLNIIKLFRDIVFSLTVCGWAFLLWPIEYIACLIFNFFLFLSTSKSWTYSHPRIYIGTNSSMWLVNELGS